MASAAALPSKIFPSASFNCSVKPSCSMVVAFKPAPVSKFIFFSNSLALTLPTAASSASLNASVNVPKPGIAWDKSPKNPKVPTPKDSRIAFCSSLIFCKPARKVSCLLIAS